MGRAGGGQEKGPPQLHRPPAVATALPGRAPPDRGAARAGAQP